MSRKRTGFTLIELLIVVVIIGILAAIAIPKFVHTKEKAYLATMKTDLRNLVTAQETYWVDNKTYFASSGAIVAGSPQGNWAPSSGVSATVTATASDWSATAAYPAVTTKTCVIYFNQPPSPPATNQGEPACD